MPRISIWESTASIALVGMGAAGVVSPVGLQGSQFFPIIRSVIPPAVIAGIILTVGCLRLMIMLAALHQTWTRCALSFVSALIWMQWALGFLYMMPIQGARPGMMQLAAMVFGELSFIYWLMRESRRVAG